jgi:hypothetical protein
MAYTPTCPFYLCLHSDASIATFPNNRSGCFKSQLARPIDLGNLEYEVAIASVSQYYVTSMDDVVFIRQKRQAPTTTPNISKVATYPPGDTASIAEAFKAYLKSSTKYYGYYEGDVDDKTWVKVTVGANFKLFGYMCNPSYLKLHYFTRSNHWLKPCT